MKLGLYDTQTPETLLSVLDEWTDFHSELYTFSRPTLIWTGGNGASDFNTYTLDDTSDAEELIELANDWVQLDTPQLTVHSLHDATRIITNTPGVDSLVVRPDSQGLYMVADTLDLIAIRLDSLADLISYGDTYAEYFSLDTQTLTDNAADWLREATLAGDTHLADAITRLLAIPE